jgi:acyl-CoA synthetase (AMP-forming)/AMP-acid ligase II
MLLREPLSKAARFFSHKQAIVCEGDRFTYGEFVDRVHRLANGLNGFGIGKDGKVAILHPNCHVFMEAYHAAALIGAALVPINYRLSTREIAFILNDSESELLIASPEFEGIVEEIRKSTPVISKVLFSGKVGSYENVVTQSSANPPPMVPAEGSDLAQIYYTSGTTGRPSSISRTVTSGSM